MFCEILLCKFQLHFEKFEQQKKGTRCLVSLQMHLCKCQLFSLAFNFESIISIQWILLNISSDNKPRKKKRVRERECVWEEKNNAGNKNTLILGIVHMLYSSNVDIEARRTFIYFNKKNELNTINNILNRSDIRHISIAIANEKQMLALIFVKQKTKISIWCSFAANSGRT